MKIRNIATSLLLGVISVTTGCYSRESNSEDGRLDIVVSIPPQKYIVESIGGQYVKVESIMNSDANPESFEPTVATMLSVADADAYIPLGLLEFEQSLISKLRENSPELDIYNGAKNISLLFDTHGECNHSVGDHNHDHHHHHGEAPDPHVWSSVRNMKIMASTAADILMEKAPMHKEYFIHNRDSVIARLDSIESTLSMAISQSGDSAFLVWHPSLSYLANDYNLKQIVVGSHSKELSVRQLQQRINDAAQSAAGLFFIQQEFDSGQASTLNGHVNAKIIELNTMSEDWEKEIKKIADGFSGEKNN